MGASAVPAATAAPAYRGVTVHSLSNEQVGDMDRTLDAAKDLGANTIRVDVWWSVLEGAGKRRYAGWYLNRFDRFVEGAHARGMKVLPILLWTPCWASSAPARIKSGCLPSFQSYPPTSSRDYGDIVRFVANRYRSKLAGIAVWNEPNLTSFLTGPSPASAYVGLVKAANVAAKSVRPAVRVVAGNLSRSDRGFLEKLYAYGMKGNYDALSIHPYNGANAPETKMHNRRWEFLGGIRYIRAAQAAAGDQAPLWLGEFGWNTSDLRGVAPLDNGVDKVTQAAYLARALELLDDPTEDLGYVKGAFVYEMRDLGTNRLVGNENYGLVRKDFSPKPSFRAVKSAFAVGCRSRRCLRRTWRSCGAC